MTVSTAYLPLVLSVIIFCVQLRVQTSQGFPLARLRESTSSILSGVVELGLMCHSTALRSLKIAEVPSKEKRYVRPIVEERQGSCSSQGAVIASQILPFEQRPGTNEIWSLMNVRSSSQAEEQRSKYIQERSVILSAGAK
jgi:hypothetical protein